VHQHGMLMKHAKALARRALPLGVLLTAGAAAVALAVAGGPRRAAALPVHLEPGVRLGGMADSGEAFGLVGDVAAHEDGRIFVLDVLLNRVLVFARDGGKLGSFGGPGRGPGEIDVPAALAVDTRGRVYVLDRGNARISVYEGQEGDLAPVAPLPLDFNAEDLCLADGRLYALGERNGMLIHELSPNTGAPVRSFAPDAAAREPVMRGARSNGYLGCADGRDDIVFLPILLPEVRRYDVRTGALVGTDTIPGYRAVRIRRLGGGVAFEGPRDGPHHVGAGVIPINAGQWLVQTAFARPGAQSLHELESVRSYLLSPRDGVHEVTGEHPRLVSARGRTAFRADTDPHPLVEVVDLRPAPE